MGGGMTNAQDDKGGKDEQRTARRFPLQVPASVTASGTSGPVEVRNVSARGISFYMDSAPEEGTPIGFTLTLPAEITMTESIQVQCKGRVVRVESNAPQGKMAVAAVIEEFELLPAKKDPEPGPGK
jgi:hypothetical protein